jgi:hypothetical protein
MLVIVFAKISFCNFLGNQGIVNFTFLLIFALVQLISHLLSLSCAIISTSFFHGIIVHALFFIAFGIITEFCIS